MMRALTLLCSASSKRARLQASSRQRGYTWEVKTSVSPLAAHATPSASVEIVVTACDSPPITGSIQTCDFPPRVEINASRPPSGDQRGRLSEPSPVVNCLAPPPSIDTNQMCEVFLLALRSIEVWTYATHRPSGEICGSEMRWIFIMSSNVSGCLANPDRELTERSAMAPKPRNFVIEKISLALAHGRESAFGSAFA